MRFASLAAALVGVVGTVAPVEAQDEMMMTTDDLTMMLSTTSNVMQTVNYTDPTDGMEMMSYSMVPADNKDKDKRPIVVILPDWSGVDEYEQTRAAMLADQGWIAFAADIYGLENHNPESFDDRRYQTGLYRSNLTLYNSRIAEAISQASMIPGADPSKGVAVIGYCFGGSGVLQYVLSGQNGADAAIAYHGSLSTVAKDMNETVAAQVLIVSGGEDGQDSTADIKLMETALNNGGSLWEIQRYSDVDHGFSNPFSSRYNAYVEERSWPSTIKFLQKTFQEIELAPSIPKDLTGEAFVYSDPVDGSTLNGYITVPEGEGPFPAVVIIHNADGINEYEETRAQMLAEMGFVGLAADVYGPMMAEVDMTNRTELFGMLNTYRNDINLFVQRIDAAVKAAADRPEVDADKIGIIGYCFGGTGVINYALTGKSEARAIASFHGGLSRRAPLGGKIHVKMMIASGGEDDAASDIEDLEMAMKEGQAPAWEYTRYKGVVHSFTEWTREDRYNLHADVRSWEAMEVFFRIAFSEERPEIVETNMPTGMPTMIEVDETTTTSAPTDAMMVEETGVPTTMPTATPTDIIEEVEDMLGDDMDTSAGMSNGATIHVMKMMLVGVVSTVGALFAYM